MTWQLDVLEQAPLEVADSFVPWRDGRIVFPYGHGTTGYSFFQVQRFLGQGTGVVPVLIMNNTDSTLFVGQSGGSVGSLMTNPQTVVGPYHSVVVPLRLGAVSLLCVCAGYDFWTPRPLSSGTISGIAAYPSQSDTRGPAARVTLLPQQEGQGAPGALRSEWLRQYDWYDLNITQAQAIAQAPIGTPAALSVALNSSAALPNRIPADSAGTLQAFYNSSSAGVTLQQVGNDLVTGGAATLAQSSVTPSGNVIHTLASVAAANPCYMQLVVGATAGATWNTALALFPQSQ